MPLNIEPRAGGEFIPYCKFDARAGRWFTKTDSGEEEEVRGDMTAIFDLPNIKLGWLLFTEGSAPDAVWDNGAVAEKPTPKHRRGFAVNLFSPQKLGGLRELRSNSNAAISAIKELYEEQYETAPEAKRGLLPVVTCTSVTPIKSARSTNYQPVLKIQKWVPRPAAMGDPEPVSLEETVPPPKQDSSARAAARSPEPDSGEEF